MEDHPKYEVRPLRSDDEYETELVNLLAARDAAWANLVDLDIMVGDCQRRIRERDRAAKEG